MHNSKPSVAGALVAGDGRVAQPLQNCLSLFFFFLIVFNKFILVLLFGVIWVVEAVHSIPKCIH